MANIPITAINPIPLNAVVSSSGGVYSVVVQYNVPPATTADEITDSFVNTPTTVTVNVTSSTVPSGYYLDATGDGTWTLNNSSSISGAFTVSAEATTRYEFTVVVTDGDEILARHDPLLLIRRLPSMPEDRARG
jgi:hypothetical protein